MSLPSYILYLYVHYFVLNCREKMVLKSKYDTFQVDLWCLECKIIDFKINIVTFMAVIVQISYCFVIKYVEKNLCLKCCSGVMFL